LPPHQGRIGIYGIVLKRMSSSPTSCACKTILCSRMYQKYHRKFDGENETLNVEFITNSIQVTIMSISIHDHKTIPFLGLLLYDIFLLSKTNSLNLVVNILREFYCSTTQVCDNEINIFLSTVQNRIHKIKYEITILTF